RWLPARGRSGNCLSERWQATTRKRGPFDEQSRSYYQGVLRPIWHLSRDGKSTNTYRQTARGQAGAQDGSACTRCRCLGGEPARTSCRRPRAGERMSHAPHQCAQAGEREHITSTARTATATAAAWNGILRLRLRVARAEPCPICGIPYGLIRLPPACDICGAAPCL